MKQEINFLIQKISKSMNLQKKQTAVILMYHRISSVFPEPNWLAVSPDNFARHLEHIQRSYCPMRLIDLVKAVKNDSIPERAISITFDDGYFDNLNRALPLLESAKIPATVFVTTGFVGSKKEFWWDELSKMVLGDHKVPPTLSIDLQGCSYTWETSTTEQRRETYSVIKEKIKPLSSAVKELVLNSLESWSGIKRELRSDYRTMTEIELRYLAQSDFIDIGAHTISHPILTSISSENRYIEIVDSLCYLESVLSQPVLLFAYPNGDFDVESVDIVRRAGFVGACTTVSNFVKAGDNPFLLSRFGVTNWDIETFKQNLAKFYSA